MFGVKMTQYIVVDVFLTWEKIEKNWANTNVAQETSYDEVASFE